MNKTYTKSGDDGWTNAANGKRVKKHSDIIELYGCIDELNVFLGYAAESLCENQEFHSLFKQIFRIQRELFAVSSNLLISNIFAINPHEISQLEIEIDAMSERLPVLKFAILPGGGECALRIHLARTIGIYFNRLGDWLYVAARTVALILNVEETTLQIR
jgi:cob(I)alamin adenosyltransferase